MAVHMTPRCLCVRLATADDPDQSSGQVPASSRADAISWTLSADALRYGRLDWLQALPASAASLLVLLLLLLRIGSIQEGLELAVLVHRVLYLQHSSQSQSIVLAMHINQSVNYTFSALWLGVCICTCCASNFLMLPGSCEQASKGKPLQQARSTEISLSACVLPPADTRTQAERHCVRVSFLIPFRESRLTAGGAVSKRLAWSRLTRFKRLISQLQG